MDKVFITMLVVVLFLGMIGREVYISVSEHGLKNIIHSVWEGKQ